MQLAIRLSLSTLSAALMVLSVPTFDLWPLMWVGLLPALYVALTAATPRRAFLHGWLTGVLANTAAFYWMKGLLERFGHMPGVEAIPIMLLLTTYQGLEFGLWSWGVHRLARRRPDLPLALLAPLVMVAIELLVPQIFPFYLAISQAWVPPVIQIADLTGPMGVTFVMVMVTGALYDAGRAARGGRTTRTAGTTPPPTTRTTPTAGTTPGAPVHPIGLATMARLAAPKLAIPVAVVGLVLAYGLIRIHQMDGRREAAPKAEVGIVQANVGISEKWDPAERGRLLTLHQQQSALLAGAGADLIVWPESSYPYAVTREMTDDYPPADPRRIRGGVTTPTLFGAVTLSRDPSSGLGKDRFPYNTALMVDEAGHFTGKYDKVFLLIFGEYIPFYDRVPWFTRLFPEASNFNRGDAAGSFPFRLRGRDYRLGPLICYEDILPGFTRKTAALDPNLLVNITNDAWFGKTAEPYQHLALAVFRSVENRLEMVRAVNTGVSAHIDAAGRVRTMGPAADPDAEPPPRPTALLVRAALLDRGGLYARVGDLFAWACVAALVALGTRGFGRGRAQGRSAQRRRNG
jgi:apolipoprotein N-acyltransferase